MKNIVGGKMKKLLCVLFALLSLSALVAMLGCGKGGDPGAPGTGGSEETGILIKSVTISRASPDLDVFSSQTACTGSPEKNLTREDATITIDATRLNTVSAPANTYDPFPASVEQCTITYMKANEDPAAPTIPQWTIYPNCTIADSTSNACSVSLIDISRKQIYWDAIIGGQNKPAEYPTHYVAVYRCSFTNNIDKTGTFQVEYDFWLADFLVCQ